MLTKNKKDAEYDPWYIKHGKWAKEYKFKSYKDMCDYWIKNKNAPLLGGEMEEIVKGFFLINTIQSNTAFKTLVKKINCKNI